MKEEGYTELVKESLERIRERIENLLDRADRELTTSEFYNFHTNVMSMVENFWSF